MHELTSQFKLLDLKDQQWFLNELQTHEKYLGVILVAIRSKKAQQDLNQDISILCEEFLTLNKFSLGVRRRLHWPQLAFFFGFRWAGDEGKKYLKWLIWRRFHCLVLGRKCNRVNGRQLYEEVWF